MENGIEKEIFEMVEDRVLFAVVGILAVVLVPIGLSWLGIFLFFRLLEKTYEFRRQLANKWQTRHMPKLVVWENITVTAVARRNDYRRAVKRNPGVKYPIVPEAVTFADPYTTYGEILTQTQPHYFRRNGVSGTKNDLKVLLGNCVVERCPMFVPFTSFAVMGEKQQLRTFIPFGSAEEACRYLLWKSK